MSTPPMPWQMADAERVAEAYARGDIDPATRLDRLKGRSSASLHIDNAPSVTQRTPGAATAPGMSHRMSTTESTRTLNLNADRMGLRGDDATSIKGD